VKKLPLIVGALAVVALVGFAVVRSRTLKPAAAAALPAKAPDELAVVPRIPLATARQEIDSRAVVVIDVRDADAYVAGHIPGALQIPLMRIEGEVNYLPRAKPILTYCT
jgi:3-mercaptopyruvate sulfurtransferase SseA